MKADRDFEQFPAEKRQIRYEEPPELIFFDVDEESEEADFILVDDLFSMEPDAGEKLTGRLSFTLIPEKAGELIGSRLSRVIHKTLILSGIRMEHPLEKVRIRPHFAQWQIEVKDSDDMEMIAREFRADLEEQLHNLVNLSENERYWSNNCFVSRIDREIPDETIIRAAAFPKENYLPGRHP